MKNKNFPNWVPTLLLFLIAGILIFYYNEFGSPSKLITDAENSEKMQTLFNKQAIVVSIKNGSYYKDYEVEKLQVTYLDSSFSLHQEPIPIQSKFNDGPILLAEKYPINWKGRCLLAIVEYWKKNNDGEIEMKYQLFKSEDIKSSGGILEITN